MPEAQRVAQMILSCVARAKGAYGAAHIADILRGRGTKRVAERGHAALSTFGLLAGSRREAVLGYIDQLIDAGALERDGGEQGRYPTLRLNAASWDIMRGSRDVSLVEAAQTGPDKPERPARRADALASLDEAELALFESLRALRRQIAEERAVPPYIVFGDAPLIEMARVRPGSDRSFVTIKGVGQAKVTEFGERFVDHIRGYCREHGLRLDAMAGSRPRRGVDQ